MRGDGKSLIPLLDGQHPADWRNAILVEHQGRDVRSDRPDYQEPVSGNPDTYEAMRTSTFLYTEYKDQTHEFYNLRTDPYELHNIVGKLSRQQRLRLDAELLAIKQCHDAITGWAAMHVAHGP